MSEAWQAFADAATRSEKFAPLGYDAIHKIQAIASASLANVDTSRDGEIRAQCPFHISDGGGFTQTLRVNVSPHSKYGIGFFKCYSCLKKGHWNILAEHIGVDPLVGEANPEISNLLMPLQRETEVRGFDASKLATLPPTFSWKRKDGVITQRALSIVDCKLWYRSAVPVFKVDEKMKVILDGNGQRIVDFYAEELRLWMPVYEEETIVAHVAALVGERHWWSKKYLNAKGDWPKKHIWPLAQIMKKMRDRSVIVIVEGPADALRLIDAGIPAIANLGVSSWTQAKAEIISTHYNRVVMCFDADAAGELAQKTVSETFRGLIPAKCIRLPKGKDPASLSDAELEKLITLIRR